MQVRGLIIPRARFPRCFGVVCDQFSDLEHVVRVLSEFVRASQVCLRRAGPSDTVEYCQSSMRIFSLGVHSFMFWCRLGAICRISPTARFAGMCDSIRYV